MLHRADGNVREIDLHVRRLVASEVDVDEHAVAGRVLGPKGHITWLLGERTHLLWPFVHRRVKNSGLYIHDSPNVVESEHEEAASRLAD